MSLADDFGDSGGDWTAEWRTLSLVLSDMYALQIDTQLRVLKNLTLKVDAGETADNLERLAKAITKLERDAERYARKAEQLRREIAVLGAALHAHRSTWTPPEPAQSEWGSTANGIDDEVVDRMARLYMRHGHDIR